MEHDAAATRSLLILCRELSGEQWQTTFEFGQGSLYGTFDHMIDSQEYWTSLMQGRPGPFAAAPLDPARSLESLTRRFEAVSPEFIAIARTVRDENRLGDMFVDIELGPVRRTYGAAIVHVTTHNMHHRAQVRAMFDLMGAEYNPFSGYAMDSYPLQ